MQSHDARAIPSKWPLSLVWGLLVLACLATSGLSFPSSGVPTCFHSIASAARDIVTGTSSTTPPEIVEDPRRPVGWVPSSAGDGAWISGSMRASNLLVSPDKILVFPGNWEHFDCTPQGFAEAFKIFAHEFIHNVCPMHAKKGTPELQDGAVGPKPTGAAPKPDCNDLNYAMQTAKAICDLIGNCAGCLVDCPKEDVCPPLLTAGGLAIEGTETCAKIAELCKALSKAHSKMQTTFNTPGNASTAFNCKCGSSPWSPGASYPNCPPMPAPPAGCQGNTQDSYPNNGVIPDCPDACPQ